MPEVSQQNSPSAIVVGARTRRQGTGPFIAAGLAAAGLAVRGIVGTSAASVAEARQQLAASRGLQTAGFTSIESALEATAAEVVAICSPWQVHREQLLQVAAAGRHCLCEKPLAWPLDENAAIELVDAFTSRNLLLQVVNQWPTTLPFFSELHGARAEAPQRFAMRLSPISIGPDMITDAAPHFIGMLQALAGPGNCTNVRIRTVSAEELQLDCLYEHANGSLAARLVLKTQEQRPRPAWYQVDELRADREVELPAYRQYLVSGERRISLPDPIALVTAKFVRDLQAGATTRGELLLAAHRNLLQLATAWDQ